MGREEEGRGKENGRKKEEGIGKGEGKEGEENEGIREISGFTQKINFKIP